MRIQLTVFLLLGGLLPGCASRYDYRPSVIAQTATLQVTRKLPHVYLFDSPDAFKRTLDPQDVPTPVPVGRRLWVELGYLYANRTIKTECVVTFSFVPEAGKHYELGYVDGGRRCYGMVMERGSDGKLQQVPSTVYKPS